MKKTLLHGKIKKIILLLFIFIISPFQSFAFSGEIELNYHPVLNDDYLHAFDDILDGTNLFKTKNNMLSGSLFNEFQEIDRSDSSVFFLDLQGVTSSSTGAITGYFNYNDVNMPVYDYNPYLARITTILNDIRLLLILGVLFYIFNTFVDKLRPFIYLKN